MSGGDERREPPSLLQQADALDHLLDKLQPREGGAVLMVVMQLDQPIIDDIALLAQRVRRMAPHEDSIRSLVTRK